MCVISNTCAFSIMSLCCQQKLIKRWTNTLLVLGCFFLTVFNCHLTQPDDIQTTALPLLKKKQTLCYLSAFSKEPQSSVLVPPVSVLTWASACAGGVGVPALSVEDHPGGRGCRVHRGSPAAAALLAARVGRQGHLHTRLTEGRTHSSPQDHGRKTSDITFFFCCNQSFL